MKEVRFRARLLRFRMRAVEAVGFPPGKAANTLRGALGMSLLKVACRCAPGGPHAAACRYAAIFEPRAEGSGPSGLADRPRPFVLRASGLDGLRASPGETFAFGINVFDGAVAGVLREAFAEAAEDGLGAARGRCVLEDVDDAGASVDLAAAAKASQVRVQFLTPTELKGASDDPAAFAILAARVRDRISTLCALYGGTTIEMDFRAFGERAAQVSIVHRDLLRVDVERRSSRSGQRHGIGGFTGVVEYTGDLGEFVPWLKAAEIAGVGRQTAWGKGEIRISVTG